MGTPNAAPHPIRAVMAIRRLTITALAEQAGVSRGYLGRVVNGTLYPSPDLRKRLGWLLDYDPQALFRDQQPQPVALRFPGDQVVRERVAADQAERDARRAYNAWPSA